MEGGSQDIWLVNEVVEVKCGGERREICPSTGGWICVVIIEDIDISLINSLCDIQYKFSKKKLQEACRILIAIV